MLESSIASIGSPLACVLVLIVAGVIAARVTAPARKKKRYPIIEEMSDPTPAQKAKQAREDEAWQEYNDDIARFLNP